MEKQLAVEKKPRYVNYDLLSYLAVVITLGTAFFYYFALKNPVFLLWAIALIIVRMVLNKIDGDIAFERGSLSMKGKIINALPDRYSDAILIVGIGISPFCRPVFSLLGIASMLLISYAGLLGKALGVDWQNQGPLGKLERLVFIILFSLIQFIFLVKGRTTYPVFGLTWTPLEWCMALFIVLGQLTVINRIRGIGNESAKVEWLKEEKYKTITQKILIAYDSQTGNTERVAEEISNCLKVGIRRIDDIKNVESYDLVIFGSREAGGRPSQKLVEFVSQHQNIKNYAIFITYKNKFWGPLSTFRGRSYFKKLLNKNPLAVFSCKAAFEQDQIYLEHPTDRDLLNAFLFGIKLTKKMNKLK